LQSALLVQDVNRRVTQIQTAADVSRAASSIMETDALVKKAVELIRQRFNLYYVGLFLVTRARVGRAACRNREAGEAMLAKDHQLPVDEHSMVGWSLVNRQPRIAQTLGPILSI